MKAQDFSAEVMHWMRQPFGADLREPWASERLVAFQTTEFLDAPLVVAAGSTVRVASNTVHTTSCQVREC